MDGNSRLFKYIIPKSLTDTYIIFHNRKWIEKNMVGLSFAAYHQR